MKTSTKAIQFLEALAIPEGPKTGELIWLAVTQGKPSADLTARLGTKGQLTRTVALMAIYGDGMKITEIFVQADFAYQIHRFLRGPHFS
jgi:hypothetical protein